MEILLGWLIKQGGMIVIAGVVIYWLQDRLKKTEERKERLTKEMMEVMKLWESQGKYMDENSKEDLRIKNEILLKLASLQTLLESVAYKEKNENK